MAASPSVAASHASRHSEIKLLRLNAEYVSALRTADADWLERHLAEDFRCILPTGAELNREAVMSRPLLLATVSLVEGDVSVRFEGDTAIVHASAVPQPQPDGSVRRNDYTHAWIGRDGRWQVLTTRITA